MRTICDVIKARKVRAYKSKERGSRRSYIDEYENALILLATAQGLLSEGQTMKILGVDRVTVRKWIDGATGLGGSLGSEIYRQMKRKEGRKS